MEGESLLNEKSGLKLVLTVFLSVWFAACLLLLLAVLFLYALNENVRLPSIGIVSEGWLTAFFDTWYPVALGIVFVLIPFLLIVLVNLHRIRRVFAAGGISFLCAGILSVVSGAFGASVIPFMGGDWQEILIGTASVWKEFTAVCSIPAIMLGAFCLSVYACIAVVKGGRNEKNS